MKSRQEKKIITFRFAGCIFRLSGLRWGFVTVYHLSPPPQPPEPSQPATLPPPFPASSSSN